MLDERQPLYLAAQAANPLIIGAIILAFGLYTTLTGYGIIDRNLANPQKSSAWRARWGRQARISGPLLIVAGLLWLGYHLFWAR